MNIYFDPNARTVGAIFPLEDIELKNDNIQKAKNGKPFEQDGFQFTFDETVAHNGWWAVKIGLPGTCMVALQPTAAKA